MGMQETYSVCDDCRKKLHESTGMDFEQYSLPHPTWWNCRLCRAKTVNWFTDHGIETLNKAINKVYPRMKYYEPGALETLQHAVTQLKETFIIEFKATRLWVLVEKLNSKLSADEE